ncbi:MAG: cytochrome b/b6 domain-containing protein [Woeseia sp.]
MNGKKPKPHSRTTRFFHMSIALLVISQLATSKFMVHPGKDREGDLLFEIHEYSGMLALFVICGFWLHILRRGRGTNPALLFPWFSSAGLQAFWIDVKAHLKSVLSFKIPDHVENGPLASGVHGLGILLISLMTATGTTWFISQQIGDSAKWWGGAAKEVHEIFSNLVWVYFIAHAGLAIINQFAGKQPLSDMWSVKGDNET